MDQLNAEISRLNGELASAGGHSVKGLSVQPAKMPLAEIKIPAEAFSQNQKQLNKLKENLVHQLPKN